MSAASDNTPILCGAAAWWASSLPLSAMPASVARGNTLPLIGRELLWSAKEDAGEEPAVVDGVPDTYVWGERTEAHVMKEPKPCSSLLCEVLQSIVRTPTYLPEQGLLHVHLPHRSRSWSAARGQKRHALGPLRGGVVGAEAEQVGRAHVQGSRRSSCLDRPDG